MREDLFLSILRKYLKDSDCCVLDFGGGIGRYEPMLSKIMEKVYAIDIVKKYKNCVPKINNVKYFLGYNLYYDKKKLNFKDSSIDIIFDSVSLGAIVDKNELIHIINEFKRITKPNALFFIVEDVADTTYSDDYWIIRTEKEYFELFNFVDLKIESALDGKNGIGFRIFVGRKK